MQKRQSETKTETKNTLSPYQAEKAEAQAVPVSRPARAGEALLRLQRRVGNRAVQRLLAQRQEPEEEEELQFKRLAQRRGGGEAFTLDDETAGRINRARGGGQPLDRDVAEQMGDCLSFDFSRVWVHTGSEADTLNQQLSARAFTTGRDIFFRRGEYNPGSSGGRELIAHELSHVVQQSTGRVPGAGGGMTVRPGGDAFEQEADVMGREATQSKRIGSLQRAVANPATADPAYVLALQRTYGNRAVQRARWVDGEVTWYGSNALPNRAAQNRPMGCWASAFGEVLEMSQALIQNLIGESKSTQVGVYDKDINNLITKIRTNLKRTMVQKSWVSVRNAPAQYEALMPMAVRCSNVGGFVHALVLIALGVEGGALSYVRWWDPFDARYREDTLSPFTSLNPDVVWHRQ